MFYSFLHNLNMLKDSTFLLSTLSILRGNCTLNQNKHVLRSISKLYTPFEK